MPGVEVTTNNGLKCESSSLCLEVASGFMGHVVKFDLVTPSGATLRLFICSVTSDRKQFNHSALSLINELVHGVHSEGQSFKSHFIYIIQSEGKSCIEKDSE